MYNAGQTNATWAIQLCSVSFCMHALECAVKLMAADFEGVLTCKGVLVCIATCVQHCCQTVIVADLQVVWSALL